MIPLVVLLVAYTLSQFYRAFLAIVAADLSRDLGLDAQQLGAISAIWFVTFAVAQFPVGISLDRFGPRWTMAGFMIFAVIGAGLLASAEGYAGALVAMGLIGVGCAPVLMAGLYLFGRVYPPERFGTMAALMIGLGNFGNLLGATPLALAVQAFGWRPTMAGIAVITLLAVAISALLLRDPPRVGAEDRRGDGIIAGLAEIMRLRALWYLLPITATSYAVVIATRSLWIAPFLEFVHGLGPTERGNVALAMAIAMSVGALAYGPIERRLGDAKRVSFWGCLATALLFVAFGLYGDRNLTLAVVMLCAIGALGLSYGCLMAHGRLFFPAHLLGRGVTFLNFAFIAGAGALQWLSGVFVQGARDAGWPPDAIFSTLNTAFGVLLLATTAIYAFAPTRPVPRP